MALPYGVPGKLFPPPANPSVRRYSTNEGGRPWLLDELPTIDSAGDGGMLLDPPTGRAALTDVVFAYPAGDGPPGCGGGGSSR